MTLSISDTRHNNAMPCAECCYAECRVLFMLSVVMPNVIMLSVAMLSVLAPLLFSTTPTSCFFVKMSTHHDRYKLTCFVKISCFGSSRTKRPIFLPGGLLALCLHVILLRSNELAYCGQLSPSRKKASAIAQMF